MIEVEEWVGVPNYIGYYEVSNMGKVRSLDRMVNNKIGKKTTLHKGMVLKGGLTNDTLMVVLSKDSKAKSTSVKSLVAKLFLNYNQSGDLTIKHINGNLRDCSVGNLQITTRNKPSVERVSSRRYIGVSKSKGVWKARVLVDGQLIYLGKFNTLEDAQHLYNLALTNKDKYNGSVKEFINNIVA